MKTSIFLLFLLLTTLQIFSQVVTTAPEIPTDNQGVTITFHAERGDKGLMNYPGNDVYAHTGVITDMSTSSSDWKYVKASWTTNQADCKLTKLSANEYTLSLNPDIRQFYGVPANEKILKIAFVFRNSTGSKTGRDTGGADIFTSVFTEGLNVSFLQPSERFTLVNDGQKIFVEIVSTGADSLLLYLDNILLHNSSSGAFDTLLAPTDHLRHRLVARASSGNNTISDTTWYMVAGTTVNEALPAGTRDGIQYPSQDSVIFVLYAPDKDYIYLTGDFNDWIPDNMFLMKKDGERFWISLGGLLPGKEYAFQYLIDGELRIADPYSEKVLDPDNDKYIPASVYPDLMPYPQGKTSQITGVIQPGKEPFVWNEEDYVIPAPQNLIIYELLIRDFVTSHDIKDVAEKLDYLQKLGVNAIELMPFSEFEGNSSWGYNPSFYFATDKYYGQDTDIKEFIQECHRRGMAVIMDIVLNHAYGHNPMVRMYFNRAEGRPSPDNPWFNEISPNMAYSWGYDFNHESTATRYFVDRVVEYWLTEYKVDGFRFDFTKGFTNTPGDGSSYDESRISILKRIYNCIKSINAEAIMICEHFAPNSEEEKLSDYGMLIWGNSNYNYNEATMGYIQNSDLSWSSYLTRGWNNPNLVSYMESHDEERLMFKNITYGNASGNYNVKDLATALQRMELAGIFLFSIPGPKMIWQFSELGYDISIDFNGRLGEKPIKWEYLNDPLREKLYLTWAKMLEIRKKYPVFQTDDFTLTAGNHVAGKKILLRHDEMDVIVAGNFGLTSISVKPGYTRTGWWYELFAGDSLDVADVNAEINLLPGEYRLYGSKKLESNVSGFVNMQKESLYILPNPVKDIVYIETESKINHINIFDLSGNLVLSDYQVSGQNVMDVTGLQRGMYIILVQTGDRVIAQKFMKQ